MDLTERLAVERRARLAAERMLERQVRPSLRRRTKHRRPCPLPDRPRSRRPAGRGRTRSAAKAAEPSAHTTGAQTCDAESAVQIAERRLWDSLETIRDGFAVFDPGRHADGRQPRLSRAVRRARSWCAPGITLSGACWTLAGRRRACRHRRPSAGGLVRADAGPAGGSTGSTPSSLQLWNGQFVKPDRPADARRRPRDARAQHHRDDPARERELEDAPRPGRGREPREVRLPRQHEPRDPDADERRRRHGRASARTRA